MREGRTTISVGDLPYDVTVYLTKSRDAYWVRVHAHKATGKPRGPSRAPISGGRIV